MFFLPMHVPLFGFICLAQSVLDEYHLHNEILMFFNCFLSLKCPLCTLFGYILVCMHFGRLQIIPKNFEIPQKFIFVNALTFRTFSKSNCQPLKHT